MEKEIEDQEMKKVEVLKASQSEENKKDIKWIKIIFPKDVRTNWIKNEINLKYLKYDLKHLKFKICNKNIHTWFSAICNNKSFWW